MTDAHRVELPHTRGNGVTAEDYLRVARPTEPVAELALAALRRTGIAARVCPAALPDRVELWVDARELGDALTVLAAVVRHAGLAEADLGRAGEERVLDDLGAAPSRPAGADHPGEAADPDLPADGSPPRNVTRNPTPSARPYPTPSRPQPPRSATEADDVDDDPDAHFRPDEPESLRTLSPTTVWALVILAVGVVVLALAGLVPQLVGAYAPLASLLGTAAVLVGVGMLVTRLRDGRPDDDDRGGPNGDGAIL